MSSFNTDSLKDFSKCTRAQFFYNLILPSDDDLHLCMLSESGNYYNKQIKRCFTFSNLIGLAFTTTKVCKNPKMNVNLIIIGRIYLSVLFQNIIMRKSQLAMHKTQSTWSIRQVNALRKFKNKLYETESEQVAEKMLQKQDNSMQFYEITPKDELPKNLQKMNFQTLNTKQNSIEGIVKVHKKHNLNKKQEQIRKMLRNSGQIMLLSEIYNYLDDSFQPKINQKKFNIQATPLSNVISQLDQWEKSTCKKGTLEARFSKLRLPNLSTEDRRNSAHKKEFISKKFKLGSDYKTEIEKNLQTISFTHNNQQNLLSRYNMIQNSSKMLKKELEEMKEIVKKQIEEKMKKLAESRKEHHRLYEEKLKLQIEEQELDLQMAKQEANSMYSSSGYGFHTLTQSNMKIVFEDKRNQLEKNQVKINKIKKNIELLEQQTFKNQEQLKNILMAQNIYFRISLRNGIDCRDSGLVWIIKKLKIQESDISNIEFPDYLDKKSKAYLMNKAKSEQILEQVLQEKRIFITEVGKQSEPETRSSFRSPSRKSSIKLEKAIQKSQIIDEIKQVNNSVQCESDIPKRYSRSLKKITALREEYLKNENLFKLTQGRGGLKFGNNLTGMTGKQIYENIGEKIKQVDFSKLKKQKAQQKSDKLFEYQAILKKIEQLHMQIEEQDIQHEAHLLSQYKDEKELFFRLAAACFGVKRAYSLIIKNFSWKNTI